MGATLSIPAALASVSETSGDTLPEAASTTAFSGTLEISLSCNLAAAKALS